MKIAFVYDAVYPWVKGGGEKRIFEIGKRLAANGNEVHLFGVKWWEGNDVIEKDGMVLHGVCRAWELYKNGRRSIIEAVIFSINLPFHLLRERFDVIDVSVFPYFPCFAVKLVSIVKKTPILITWFEVWGDYWYEYLGTFGLFGKIIENLVSKLGCRCIALSEATKRCLVSLGVDNNMITILSGGVDIREIQNISQSIEKYDIIFIGRLIKEKNVDILLKAVSSVMKSIPSARCLVIGGGPEMDRLVDLSSELGIQKNVIFNAFLEYDEVISRLKSSKVLVLPSGREGFGMVVVEAYACGVPVITIRSRKNAASELVNGTTGLVVDLDPVLLSKAILSIITDTEVHSKMSESALIKAKEFEWDNIIKQLSGIYEEMIRGRAKK